LKRTALLSTSDANAERSSTSDDIRTTSFQVLNGSHITGDLSSCPAPEVAYRQHTEESGARRIRISRGEHSVCDENHRCRRTTTSLPFNNSSSALAEYATATPKPSTLFRRRLRTSCAVNVSLWWGNKPRDTHVNTANRVAATRSTTRRGALPAPLTVKETDTTPVAGGAPRDRMA
jgi:hypothetical protein